MSGMRSDLSSRALALTGLCSFHTCTPSPLCPRPKPSHCSPSHTLARPSTQPDAALFAKLNRHHHDGPVAQNHAVVDVTTVNPQWTALLDEWDVLVLQTGAAWKDLRAGGTQMVVANAEWKAMLNMDNYAGHL